MEPYREAGRQPHALADRDRLEQPVRRGRAGTQPRRDAAEGDPKFADRDLPDGYVTTRPVARVPFFFNVANVESRVLEVDERLKSTFTPGEGEGFAAVLGDPGLSRAIRVPVLVVVGERDGLFCDDPVCSAASSEYQHYSPAAQVQVSVIPAAAHARNLHRNAPDVFATIRTWTDTHFRPVTR